MRSRVDLLTGNIVNSLASLALPIMLTSLIQMAYNMIDMIWIGRVGSDAVAAVGAAGMFMWLAQGLITLCRAGGQVKVGQSLGAKNYSDAKLYVKTAIQMSVIFAIVYSLILLIFANQLIGFFNFEAQVVINDAQSYLKIVGAGIVFMFLNQVITGMITVTGNSRTPFFVNSVGLVANIILDPLFIFGIGPIEGFGVAGAAIATVLAQIVVFSLYLVYIKTDSLFYGIKLLSKPDMKKVKIISEIGIPPAAQSCMFTFIAMYLSRIVASFGAAAVAVQKVGSQVESISWMTADGFGVALNSFISQNYGAGNFDRAKKGYFSALRLGIMLGIVTSAILIIFASPIFYAFIPEADVLPMGIDYLVILGYSQMFMCVEIITNGAFAAFGKTKLSATVNVAFTLLRIPMAIVLIEVMGSINGIWWSITISSIIRGILIPSLFILFLRKKEKEYL